jgi:hypothetical protein
MNKSAISKFIGVFVSLVVIWGVNLVMLINPCLEEGGVFIYEQGQCLLEGDSIFTTGFEIPLVFSYVFIGLSVSYFTSKLISKFIK